MLTHADQLAQHVTLRQSLGGEGTLVNLVGQAIGRPWVFAQYQVVDMLKRRDGQHSICARIGARKQVDADLGGRAFACQRDRGDRTHVLAGRLVGQDSR